MKAHSSLLSDWLFFFLWTAASLSSIAILHPFLINLLFTAFFPLSWHRAARYPHKTTPTLLSLTWFSHHCSTKLPCGVKVDGRHLPFQSHSSDVGVLAAALVIHSPEILWCFCLYPHETNNDSIEPLLQTAVHWIPFSLHAAYLAAHIYFFARPSICFGFPVPSWC